MQGTNVVAQLVYRDNSGHWVADPTLAPFFPPTFTTFRGYWNGNYRTLVNAGGVRSAADPTRANPVEMEVRYWDTSTGNSYDTASLRGTSGPFTYIEEFDMPAGTDDKQMKALPSFTRWWPCDHPQFVSASRAEGQLRFQIGDYYYGFRVIVETKTDLGSSAPWIPIHTNYAPFWFTNSTTDAQRRYFRAVYR